MMLVPAGVLILVMLGAICVDSSIAFMAQREMENDAAAVANDSITQAISESQLQNGRQARPNPDRVNQIVYDRLVGARIAGTRIAPGDVSSQVEDLSEGSRVTVSIDANVPYVFAKAFPWARHSVRLHAVSQAETRFGN